MKIVFCFCALVLFDTLALAQDQWLNYTNNFDVTDVVEADDGIWLSSSGGLCFVDADTKEETYYNRGNSEIPSNAVYDILLHPSGDLWVTTGAGMSRFSNGEFQTIQPKLTGLMRLNHEQKIVVANYDSLFIETEPMVFEAIAYPNYVAGIGGVEIDSEGVIYVNAINFFAETYVASYENEEWEILYSDFVYQTSIVLDDNEDLWLVNSEGLHKYSNSVWDMVTTLDEVDAFSIGRLFIDIDGNVIVEIQTDCPKLIQWNGTERSDINFVNGECEDCHFIKPSSKTSNTFFAANRKQGFYTFDLSSVNDFQPYTQSPLYLNSVITTLHRSTGEHLVIFSDKIQRIENEAWSEIEVPSGLTSGIRFAGLKTDQLWVSENEFLWFLENENWNKITPPSSFLGDIQFMVIGENDDIWIQTGTTFARLRNEVWDVYTASQHNITTGIVQDMLVSPLNGDLWVSTFLGVHQYDGVSWSPYVFPDVNHTFGLALSNEGVFVKQAGLNFIENDGDIVTIPMPGIGYYGSFESEMVYDLERNMLFLSGSNHLAVYKNEAWTVFTLDNSGVYNGFSNDLKIDIYNNLWLSGSGGGLEVFNMDGVSFSGVEDQPKGEELPFLIYPTLVANHEIFIKTEVDGKYKLLISDFQGRQMIEEDLILNSGQISSYSMPAHLKGMCFVTLRNDKGHSTKKVVFIGG